jgi:hypothetical protein
MKYSDLFESPNEYDWAREITAAANQRQQIPQSYCIRDGNHKLVKSGMSADTVQLVLKQMEADKSIMKRYKRLYISKV